MKNLSHFEFSNRFRDDLERFLSATNNFRVGAVFNYKLLEITVQNNRFTYFRSKVIIPTSVDVSVIGS